MAGSRTTTNFAELRIKCNELLRTGQGRLVTSALAQIDVQSIPKSERLPLANVARRANLFNLGLRILAPQMLALEVAGETNAGIQAEYGFLLHKIGSTEEALSVLKRVDAQTIPDALLFRAFCHFSRWEYAEAHAVLEEYVAHQSVSPYQKLVGQVNLASSLIVLRRDAESANLLEEILRQCREGGHTRLMANGLELKTQVAILNLHFPEAESLIGEALSLLESDSTSDRLFVEKWKAVISAKRDHDTSPLLNVRAMAEKYRHWESMRDIDRHLAIANQDRDLIRKLYFGSPFEGYRRILIATPGFDFNVAEAYIVGAGAKTLDIATGDIDGRPLIKPGKAIHRLVAALMSDFYRPFKLGALHSALFPDERFDAVSSPNRVYQVMFRARKFFADNKLALTIDEGDGFFRLNRAGPLKIRLKTDVKPHSTLEIQLAALIQTMAGRSFPTRDAVHALKLSETSCKRVLRYGLQSEKLVREGSGSGARYRAANVDQLKKSS